MLPFPDWEKEQIPHWEKRLQFRKNQHKCELKSRYFMAEPYPTPFFFFERTVFCRFGERFLKNR